MSRAKHVVIVAVMLMIVTMPGRHSVRAQQPSIPEQLAGIRAQLTDLQSSLGSLPGQTSPLTTIQSTLTSITTTLAALQQSIANIDPTVSRAVTLATSNAYAPEGTSTLCAAQNAGTTPITVVATTLNISGVMLNQFTFNLAPGGGNGLGLISSGSHRWCKFEYEGQPGAVRAHMSVDDFETGHALAVFEAR
jgi:hypothetical protein